MGTRKSTGAVRAVLTSLAVLGGAGLLFVGGCVALFAWALRGLSVAAACHGSTAAIVRAAGQGDAGEVRRELDAGASPDVADDQANTPLGCAVPRGHAEVVEILLDRGADPNRVSGSGVFGELPLELAVERSQRQLGEMLLDHGADPNRSTPGHDLVLTQAVKARDPAFARKLLDHGADPSGRPGSRPLAEVDVESPLFDELLERGGRLSDRLSDSGPTTVSDQLLDNAATAGQLRVVRTLLDAGTDPNHTELLTPLQRAAYGGHMDVARLLIERGAAVDAGEVDTYSLEFFGSLTAAPGIAGRMSELTGGTDALSADRRWRVTPLVIAVAQQNGPMVELLLDHGADPDGPVLDGLTPLDVAALDCSLPLSGLLAARGATARTQPLEWACPVATSVAPPGAR